jgi:dCTP deaminase
MAISFFTGDTFKALAEEGTPVVRPFRPEAVQPASVDLHLGSVRYIYKFQEYTLGDELNEDDAMKETYDRIILQPGEAAFIGLADKIFIPINALGFVFPRSSITRLGITIPGVYMNPGYYGTMPITLINNSACRYTILPGVSVAQLICARLLAPPRESYSDLETAKYAAKIFHQR